MSALVLSDYDGVFADSLDVFHRAVSTLCREHGYVQPRDRATFLGVFDGNMYDGLRDLGIDDDAIAHLVERLPAHIADRVDAIPMFPGMRETLAALADRHAVEIITSNASAVVERHLRAHRATGATAVLGADRGTSKVDKIRRAMARHPGRPAWYIGDTLGDMLEGREAGARTIAVTWGWHDEERLRRGRPDRVVESPQELVALLS